MSRGETSAWARIIGPPGAEWINPKVTTLTRRRRIKDWNIRLKR
jgi:hypothetical protein